MKKILLALIVLLPVLLSSCKKKEEETPYGKTITGVQLRDISANPLQVIGTLDTKVSAGDFEMIISPTPASGQVNVLVKINKVDIKVVARLVHVLFPTVPASISMPGLPDIIAKIENQDKAGTVALEQSKDITTAEYGFGWKYFTFSFDVTSLPQGFYRVYIETSTGLSFWDNAWVLR